MHGIHPGFSKPPHGVFPYVIANPGCITCQHFLIYFTHHSIYRRENDTKSLEFRKLKNIQYIMSLRTWELTYIKYTLNVNFKKHNFDNLLKTNNTIFKYIQKKLKISNYLSLRTWKLAYLKYRMNIYYLKNTFLIISWKEIFFKILFSETPK